MIIKVSIQELKNLLDLTPPSQNILLIGKHGIGKSNVLTEYFNSINLKVVSLFLGQMSDPGDLIGLLNKNTEIGKTDFLPPYWFPIDGKPIVLFLDELNRARPEILQTIMDLALNRTLVGKKLPEGSRIISAINYGDEYQLTELDPALISRFNVYELEPSVEEWLLWAKKNSIDVRVIDFIENNPIYLDGNSSFDDYSEEMIKNPDRRAWERVSNIIYNNGNLNNSIFQKLLSGIIGINATAEFLNYINGCIPNTNLIETNESLLDLNVPQKINKIETFFAKLDKFEVITNTESTNLLEELSKFILELLNNKESEIVAYIIDLINSEKYSNTNDLLINNCNEIITRLFSFIDSIG